MSSFELEVYNSIKEADKKIPLVSVLLSGRPRLIDDIYDKSSAVIAAWLPGTSGGQGILNAISGQYKFRPNSSRANTLSMTWPSNMNSLNNYPIYGPDGGVPKIADSRFPVGFGLSTDGNE